MTTNSSAKTRVLFVDDESLVLNGLQRMLRPLNSQWEMTFVDSGAKALEAMARAPYAVVVSDMRMPGMNGAQLFAEISKVPSQIGSHHLVRSCGQKPNRPMRRHRAPVLIKAMRARRIKGGGRARMPVRAVSEKRYSEGTDREDGNPAKHSFVVSQNHPEAARRKLLPG